MDYKRIIGHEKIIDSLKLATLRDTISHSYLFEGDEGLGKLMVAKVFAKTLLCKDKKGEPCNICTSCTKFDSGNHPDFKLLEPEKGIIKKGQVEELINSVAMSPFESSRKVFVINDSHKMNPEAMNALLKTLEEPPEYINIILITSSSNNLLPTIISRCLGIKFYPVSKKKIADYLVTNYNKNNETAKFIADFTKGSVGKSIELASSDNFFQMREEVIKIIDSLLRGDKTKAFNTISFFNENKDKIDELLDIFLFWFRDIIIYKEIGKNELITNIDKIENISKHSFIDYDKINDIIEKVQQTKDNINRNVNFQLSIESMLLNIGG